MKAITGCLLLGIIVLIRADDETCTQDFTDCKKLYTTSAGAEVPFYTREELNATCDGLSDFENCLNLVQTSCGSLTSIVDGTKAMYRFQCSEDGLKLASAHGACLRELKHEPRAAISSCRENRTPHKSSIGLCPAVGNYFHCIRLFVVDECGEEAGCYYYELSTLLAEGFYKDCDVRGNRPGCYTTGLLEENKASDMAHYVTNDVTAVVLAIFVTMRQCLLD